MNDISNEELESMKDFIKSAYESDDYVCWTMVHCLEKIIEEYENKKEPIIGSF